jgi:hypothetical protein
LGQRAEEGKDPYFLLPELYAAAERSWDRGDFRIPDADE